MTESARFEVDPTRTGSPYRVLENRNGTAVKRTVAFTTSKSDAAMVAQALNAQDQLLNGEARRN